MHPPATAPRVRKTIGIDLGTTNSVIALFDGATSTLRTGRDEQGRQTFPSLVGWNSATGKLVAGRDALALVQSPDSATLPLASVKRFMGLDRSFPLGPHSLTAPEVSALILRDLARLLERTLADPHFLIDQAIITMPAYFNHNQIEATRQAGEQAGFDVVELLHEPTAAAIYYSWVENHGDATYLVYDLGGGTFDVSVIRRRLGDYEVVAVSGDPFLGGDNFDRLLASHLIETGTWKWESDSADVRGLFDPTTPEGAAPFARLSRIAEAIKVELTGAASVERFIPQVLQDRDGRTLSLEVGVSRAHFQRLIKDKIDRTIDCCHEALARARERAGIRLSDVDYIVLVGGSSRVPLVREVVQAAFANPGLPERVRCLEPLLHEPDLCVAHGAALRAAGHGTRYLFGAAGTAPDLELHLTSPENTRETAYQAAGIVRAGADATLLDGWSVRLRSLVSGLLDEVFLDARGAFSHDLELQPETDNALEWTVCDADGQERARLRTVVRHRQAGRPLGHGVLPTQIITKPLSIEVLTRGRQRVKQVVAPIGATLPDTFRCTCRTTDRSGQIVLPIYEENRVVKHLLIDDMSPSLPVGTPVEVEFAIDTRHTIEVRVRIRAAQGQDERVETATIEPPSPPRRPTRADVDEVRARLDELLEQLTGRHRARVKARAQQLQQDLLEALSYDDEPWAIQRLAELRDLVSQAELARSQELDPPWPRFGQLARHCLDLSAEVANRTGRDRDELFQHVHAQERYAEQAYEEHNQALYRECWDNLEKYAGYLAQLLRDLLPRPAAPPRNPDEDARDEVQRFREALSAVWKQVRSHKRSDLEPRLADLARQAAGFTQRLKTEPIAVLRDARRLGVEVEKIRALLEKPAGESAGDSTGLLEGPL